MPLHPLPNTTLAEAMHAPWLRSNTAMYGAIHAHHHHVWSHARSLTETQDPHG